MDEIKVYNGNEHQDVLCPVCGHILAVYHLDTVDTKTLQIAESNKAKWHKPYMEIKCRFCKTFIKVRF
jgi:phage FluMu protein Com